VAILLLGPDKLPQVARQVGAAWRSVSDFRHRMESEVRTSIPDLPSSAEIARLARSPSALLNHLSNMAPDGTDDTATSDDPSGAESPASDAHASPVTGLPVESPSASVPPSSSMPPSSTVPPTSTVPPPSTIRPPSVPPADRRNGVGAPGSGAGTGTGTDKGAGTGAGVGTAAGDPSLN
jgi:Sec-independent protein translocase protein TatA